MRAKKTAKLLSRSFGCVKSVGVAIEEGRKHGPVDTEIHGERSGGGGPVVTEVRRGRGGRRVGWTRFHLHCIHILVDSRCSAATVDKRMFKRKEHAFSQGYWSRMLDLSYVDYEIIIHNTSFQAILLKF